jgi:single-strand DNA-binding protein
MYDTYVTIVGNVLTAPEWRRTKNTGSLVAHFKVASTARRLDRESGQWVDGNSFRVRVNCWRRLAEGVGHSLITGDPVIVVGRLYTRDWVDENNNRRIGYELEAVAVGHDLSRGQSKFLRNRPAMSTSAVEDEREALRIGGEQTDSVPTEQVPAGRDDREFEDLGLALPVHPGGAASAATGSGELPAGTVLTGDDELLGAHDDLGATDDSGEEPGGDAAAGAGPFAAGAAAVPFPAAPPAAGPAAGRDGPETGGEAASPNDGAARPDLGEERRGRGRRRERTAVPV